NCETDFVTKNETFQKLTEDIADHILEQEPAALTEPMQQTVTDKDKTLAEYINSVVAKIGEKITLRRFAWLSNTEADAFDAYIHRGGIIDSITRSEGTTEGDVAKDNTMHIATVNPS